MLWTALAQRNTHIRYWLTISLTCILMSCRAPSASTGAGSVTCNAPLPDRNDVTVPANNCNVLALHIVRPDVLPKAPNVGTIIIDLYSEDASSCGSANTACSIGDNRPFVPVGQPDPKADPTRNRVHLILDFRNGQATAIVTASCLMQPGGSSQNGNKQCFTPPAEGDGTNLKFNVAADGTVSINVTLTESNAASGNSCNVQNMFNISPHNDTGTFDLTGQGANFADLTVIQNGQVVYANQGRQLSALCTTQLATRQYNYHSSSGPASLTAVDWANFTYYSSCYDNTQPFNARNGKAVNHGIYFQVYLPPTYGDLDGDGQVEAAIAYNCDAADFGGVQVFIYTGNAMHPVFLGDLPSPNPEGNFASVPSIKISNGEIQLVAQGYSATAARCCPDLHINVSYRWKGSHQFVLVHSQETKL